MRTMRIFSRNLKIPVEKKRYLRKILRKLIFVIGMMRRDMEPDSYGQKKRYCVLTIAHYTL